MKIGLDFDGVVTNSVKLKADVSKILFGVEISPLEFTKELFVKEKHLSEKQYEELKTTIYDDEMMVELMEPVAGSIDGIKELINNNHQVEVITSRNEIGVENARKWLNKFGVSIEVIGVGKGNSKADSATGFEVYIDDDVEKLELLVGVVPNLYLFSWHYNQYMNETGIAKKVSSWSEFMNELKVLF